MMDISLFHTFSLFFAAMFAGALNAIAGGGTFVTFPLLLLVGVPPVIANTTNKFALTFASLTGVLGFWREIRAIRPLLGFFLITAILGSISGSVLLLLTPDTRFSQLVPWLMLSATLIFAFGSRLLRAVSRSRAPRWTIGAGQLAIGIYGGFFAAGMGILMMALYEVSGMKNLHEMNALKSVVGLGINTVSAITFLIVGIIHWHIAAILIIGALIGGYSGAMLSKKLPQKLLRAGIVLYGASMTLYFFLR
jgi:uncharacterized membrane protein YfcA